MRGFPYFTFTADLFSGMDRSASKKAAAAARKSAPAKSKDKVAPSDGATKSKEVLMDNIFDSASFSRFNAFS